MVVFLDNLTASPAVSAKTVSAKPVVACISKSDIMLFSNNDVSVVWGVRKKALERYHKNVLYLWVWTIYSFKLFKIFPASEVDPWIILKF